MTDEKNVVTEETNENIKETLAENKNDQEENEPETRFFTLKLLATVALAFIAALLFRRSVGVIAMFPIAFVFCGASAFLDISNIAKAVIFGISVFSVNTIENKNTEVAIIFSALCILATLLFGYSANLTKKSKKKGIPVTVVSSILCIALSIIFVGNPFAAIAANDIITPYTEKNYPQNENAALGNFEFTEIYYNYETKAYCVDANSSKYPTEPSPISVNGDALYDSFYYLMEDKISQPYVSDMSAILRKNFPDTSFNIEFDGFIKLPDQAILSSSSGALYNNARYTITISGIQTGDAMIEEVRAMVNAIDESAIGYAQLTFKSGIGLWTRRCVTVDPNHIKYHFTPKLNYTHTIDTNEFSEYVRKYLITK